MLRGVLQGCVLSVFLLLWVSCEESAEDQGPVVRVAQGALRGHRLERPEGAALRTVYAFEGVPYARPPVGERRFKDPEEVEPWTGVRNATGFGPNCIQRNIITGNVSGEEDCLYLNIYTADPPSAWSTTRRPVLVFIHGGAFVQASGDMTFATPDLLLQQGVTFVIFNYRLGVMGFLNTEDSQAPGNAAMKDQVMVLRWVQRNIASFGGDPSNVTIMGTSSGGCSVHYHLLSPLSRGLFHGAVSSSGTALASWALDENPRRVALALRRRWAALCPQDEDDDIVSCLHRVPARDLVKNQYDVPTEENRYFFWNSYYVPSMEAANSSDAPFISEHPRVLLNEGRFHRVPYVTGSTTAEGILYLTYGRLTGNASRWATLDANFADVFRWELPFGVPPTPEAALRVRSFYFGNRSLADAEQHFDTQERFVQMVTDMYYFVCSTEAARLMSRKGGEAFVYQFSRDGPIGFSKEAFNATRFAGAMHGDDMGYLFDFLSGDGEPVPIPASEQPIRQRQAKIFTNVAKSGNPTPPGSGLLPWPPVTPHNESYLDMDVELSIGSISNNERIIFWRSLMSSCDEPTKLASKS